ncbi:hypothetical protein [Paenibacillus alvei]|uniref:hypothetical protein n=1 Tax=Paenibacillus alvei TaxID=44250 RepID=UPI0018CF1462|nr:hypothetical protein [Paenibacillus alvei]MBG9735548.1 hypothetical protein [Paenibacillus alvei]MBG9746721.1 hypothetical protein [Paenibacillus alvei]MCY9578503.1 hypothetical protein [Paenibacillus alvei]MCY9584824.1 hypothetical protein [Paenibacillus alvei]
MRTSRRKGTTPKQKLSASPKVTSRTISKPGRTKASAPYMNHNVFGLTAPTDPAASSVAVNQEAAGDATGGPYASFNRQYGIDDLMNTFGKIQKMFGMFQQARSMYNTFQSLMGPIALTKGTCAKAVSRRHSGKRARKLNPSIQSHSSRSAASTGQRAARK